MRDAVIIIFGEQRGHGDNVLRVVVLDGTEIAKLTVSVSSALISTALQASFREDGE